MWTTEERAVKYIDVNWEIVTVAHLYLETVSLCFGFFYFFLFY